MRLHLPVVDYLVIAFYLLLMLGVGFYFSRLMKTGRDFFIGGNRIPWWVAGLSQYMTMFSAWTFTGAASFAYQTGWYGILYFITGPVSYFIAFQLSARRWRRSRVVSPVEYVQTRFNRATHLFLSLLVIFSTAYWPAHHLASLAKITAPTLFPGSLFAIDILIIVTGLVILVYSFTGGLWAVCVTDVVQFLIFIAVCVVLIPVIFLSGDVGSITDFIRAVPPLKMTHMLHGNTRYDLWYLLGVTITSVYSSAVGVNAQRYYSVRDESSAQKVGWLVFILFLFNPLLFGIPPLVGKMLWPEVSLIEPFSLVAKADENIFIAVVMRYMPAGLVGIFLAAMMSASMSAMDSAWNAASSIVSIDVYKRFFNPAASEKQLLRVGRLATIGLCAFAIVMALIIIHSQYGIFTFSNIFFGLTGVPVTIPLLLGLLTRKISRWSAMSSIIAGIIVASVARFVLKYDLGPQYLLTAAVTLFFLFGSFPQGRLYRRNRLLSIAASAVIGLLLWFYFLAFNANPNLELSRLHPLQPGTLAPFFWITLTAALFAVLAAVFSRLYANDLSTRNEQVIAFFTKLSTPVDVEKEVLSHAEKEVDMFQLISGIAMGLALLSLLLGLAPHDLEKTGIYYAVSGMLFAIAAVLYILKKVQK